MAHYSYHNRNKRRIKDGELVDHYAVADYKGQGWRLVLEFKTEPFLRPIKESEIHRYLDILTDFNISVMHERGL